jgi:hypothetical protein
MVAWPARSRALTVLTFAFGIAFFIWIGYEDTTLIPVTILGAALPLIFLAHFLTRRFGGAPLPTYKGMLLLSAGGLLTGCLAPLSIAILMALKVSLHSHANPDYAPEVVVGVMARTPVWALGGLLLGAALALIVYTRRRPAYSVQHPDPEK